MPMKTVRERIIERVMAQLETISRHNGYTHDIGIGRVYRGLSCIEQGHPPAAAVWELAERRERNTYGGTVRTLLLKIEGLVACDSEQTAAAVANSLLGDFEKALMLSDTTLDELNDDIQDVAAEIVYLDPGSGLAAAVIDFEIRYITEWGNPYHSQL